MKCLVRWLVGIVVCGLAGAADADPTPQQWNHKGWTVADGAPGAIYAIAQTADGTLWLAGPSGLARFDGVHFSRYYGPGGNSLEMTDIKTLAPAQGGGLWIGFTIGGISLLTPGSDLHWDDKDGLPRGAVNSIVTDKQGETFAATTQGLYRFEKNRWERVLADHRNPSARVASATIDSAGTLWLLTAGRILARPAGSADFQEIAQRTGSYHVGAHGLSSGPDDSLWVMNLNKLGVITHLTGPDHPLADGLKELNLGDTSANPGVLVDHEGTLWIGGSAVRRLTTQTMTKSGAQSSKQLEVFTPADGLSGGDVNCFMEDREGNIWAGTYAGLDRFSRSNIQRVNYPNTFGATMAGTGSTIWLSTVGATSGTARRHWIVEIHDGEVVKEYPAPHFTSAYRGPDGTLWFGGRSGIARFDAGRLITVPLPVKDEVQAMVQDRSGAMWVSIVRKGVFRLADGEWSAKVNLAQLPHTPALVESVDSRGSLWFGYPGNRLARVVGSDTTLFTAADGLDVGHVTAIEARGQDVWIGGDRGLARFTGSRFAPVLTDAKPLLTGISGIVENAKGDLWVNGSAGIAHIVRRELQSARRDPNHRVAIEAFDHLDGLMGYARQLRPSPSAFEAQDGRIWFATQLGLVSIDPSQIRRNTLPPPVTVWSLNGTSVQYPSVPRIELPVKTTSVRIAYTASSLTIPERVRFRYRLEGLDKDWLDAGDRREAVYTNLGPGRYTFHVIAANNDGVWNMTGAELPFTIIPALYQTRWFYACCALVGLALLRVLYLIRIRQVTAQVHGRLQERLAERERIARELHDTLLQSVQGLVLRFRAAVVRISAEDAARLPLEQALERADDVLAEGRDRVQYLRTVPGGAVEFASAISALGEKLALEHTAAFRSTVEGTPRDLHPIVREEATFIAREALANAFQHAQAGQIEADISYGETELRILIRDDGRGIDVAVLQEGSRAGHWGLTGMRERARKIHASLTIWSKPRAGTEVDLHIPAHIAYMSPPRTLRNILRRTPALELQE